MHAKVDYNSFSAFINVKHLGSAIHSIFLPLLPAPCSLLPVPFSLYELFKR
ncbi:hypothetical protein [Moorena sp. SIO3I6]|uniref:hypothetical protein n=1 Tax=Moorena sp. SIO3I6 TaxID=2607831 RepID=UPI0013F78F06|nr:hypothetical protein [Moorena sp. SIO3I6]NEP23512.1 hypothetical protein [Moorena sp. SIO3I6]